jgi:hypothetical protein
MTRSEPRETPEARQPKPLWSLTHTIALAAMLCAAIVVFRFRPRASNDVAASWIAVARDTNYNIFVDVSRIQANTQWPLMRPVTAYAVWYRTDHRLPRLHDGKPFDREIVHSIVWCDSLWYKVLSVDMTLEGRLPAMRQVTDLRLQQWRRVALGGMDERAAKTACGLARAR